MGQETDLTGRIGRPTDGCRAESGACCTFLALVGAKFATPFVPRRLEGGIFHCCCCQSALAILVLQCGDNERMTPAQWTPTAPDTFRQILAYKNCSKLHQSRDLVSAKFVLLSVAFSSATLTPPPPYGDDLRIPLESLLSGVTSVTRVRSG